ncbi:MAG: nucleotide exchange factor GrpE [Rhodoferax sp.]
MTAPSSPSAPTHTPDAPTDNAPSAQVDIQTAENFDAQALAQCQNELAQLQAKSAELADQYLRAKADVENTRRRAEEDVAKARKFAIESFAESLLPVVDSLEAGLAVQDASVQTIREGAQATLRQLLSALERNKVTPIAPACGDRFDPHLHQAISMVSSAQPANTVVALLQKGYLINERVLRPALVTVSSGSGDGAQPDAPKA